MKKVVKMLSIFIPLMGFSIKEELLVKWSPEVLKWSDFKGSSSVWDSSFLAFTSSTIKSSLLWKDSLVFDVTSYFDPKESWTRTNDKDVLNHEQRHFDLTEVISREIRSLIMNNAVKGNSRLDMEMACDSVRNMLKVIQTKYDFETDHGRNDSMQKKWNLKIDKWLDSLKQYSETHYSIKIG